jgi:thiamine-monophosphate kinase
MTRLDEKQIIKILQKKISTRKLASEDVEKFKIGKKFAVIKTDTLVESTDVPRGMRPSEIARKSIAAPTSDFAAKGIRPLYGIISVSLPHNYPKSKILDLGIGFREASREFGIKILGGDTNEAKEIVISVMLFGLTLGFPRRSGAKNGDFIIASGPFGRTLAGLAIINGKKSTNRFKKLAKAAVFHPTPRIDFGLSAAKYLTSSMDSSDGLSTTLVEMAQQSRKKFVITNLPKDDELDGFARKNKLDLIDLVFNGGEEYEIVATVNPKNFAKIKKIARTRDVKLLHIGHVEIGMGVFLQQQHKFLKIKDLGWSHFTKGKIVSK